MMKKSTSYLLYIILFPLLVAGQPVNLSQGWKINLGDSITWAKPEFVDKEWKSIDPTINWENQGYDKYNGFAWYRLHFYLPSGLRDHSQLKENVRFFLARIDDVDATYLNGIKIGQEGRFPDESGGYSTEWDKEREYILPLDHPALHWDAENVLAIRVYDGGGGGGMFGGQPSINILDLIDYIKMDVTTHSFDFSAGKIQKKLVFTNTFKKIIEGELDVKVTHGQKIINEFNVPVSIQPGSNRDQILNLPASDGGIVQYLFTEKISGKTIRAHQEIPYILTPQESPKPEIHSAAVYGNRPGSPFQFLIAATGTRPMRFDATGLPPGLVIDKETGIITGKVEKRGTYNVQLKSKNALGETSRKLIIKIGDHICLTPPMGWNSWNCWGLSVSDEKVKSSADAMIQSGLINHGWTYMNIDDGWEAAKRSANGEIIANEKFPDMKSLSDYLHRSGLKMGIYSSPGERTCGGYLGSYQHEEQDISVYTQWGIDYLKYDWCSYGDIAPATPSLSDYQKPYLVMKEALKKTGRDIVLSLCQYGMGDVWKWGGNTGGNVWRTTGDIEDSWASLKSIGFKQETPASYNRPGYGFGDPDMLIVGQLGWSSNLHSTRLTPSEQYTHISLWSLLSAPMLIGCDLSKMDAFTYNLLANDEVIAIDQDPLGKGPKRIILDGEIEAWVKELSDGSHAVGIFNLKDTTQKTDIKWSDLGMKIPGKVRDAWRQKDWLKTSSSVDMDLPPHGCVLLRVVK
jgi:alpha-galactosidase